jgi:hypothetical protein
MTRRGALSTHTAGTKKTKKTRKNVVLERMKQINNVIGQAVNEELRKEGKPHQSSRGAHIGF